MVLSAAGFAFYSGGYRVDVSDTFYQESFWRGDAQIGIGDSEGRWQVSLIGQNITDKIYAITAGDRPFTDTTRGGTALLITPPPFVGPAPQDLIIQQNRGRQVSLEVSLKY